MESIRILNTDICLLTDIVKKNQIKSKKLDTAGKDTITLIRTGFIITIVSKVQLYPIKLSKIG